MENTGKIVHGGRKHIKLLFKAKKNGILFEQVKYKWGKEVVRLEKFRKGNRDVEEVIEETLMDEGYAELEGNDTLYVYGNAYKILIDENFQNTIGKVHNILFLFLILYKRSTFSLSCSTIFQVLNKWNFYRNSRF